MSIMRQSMLEPAISCAYNREAKEVFPKSA
jgi:hypothetical protein